MAIPVRCGPGRAALALALAWSVSAPAWAAKPKEDQSFLDHKKFHKQELVISSANMGLAELLPALSPQSVRAWDSFFASPDAQSSPGGVQAYLDPRSGAATNIIGSFPLIPGDGIGNQVTLTDLGLRVGRELREVDAAAVAAAARQFVERHASALGIDAAELGEFRAEPVTADLWQVSADQRVGGLPVRHARLVVSISHGNIVLLGTETWGIVKLNKPKADLTAEQALAAGFAYVEGQSALDEVLRAPTLEIVPIAPPELQDGEKYKGPVGKGYGHRLVWSFVFQRPPDDARWEVLVDANSGEVLALEDINLYVEREVTGGVYPLTNTGICPDAARCGTMQTGWPMPFADTGFAAPNNFTNSAGLYNYTSGTATTTLTGQFVDIVDTCGAISASSATGAISLGGSNNQHDCTTPGSGGAGNTPASRSAFYEVNKLAELARGWLPTNTWLQSRLTTNVNINQTCNAFWNGSSINFYRSGGGCRNTGEIAAIFDHEWGHGLDDFDSGGALSNSSEAYADIAAIYRLNASCVGYGFFQTLDDGCGQTVDGTGFNSNEAQQGASHCDTDCSGVRDADYLKHVPNSPDTALGFVCTSCLTGPGPCGRQVHCAAAPVRQAAWDLVKRDLTAAPFSYDTQTALMVGSKLFHQGSGNVGAWHACTCGSSSSGCGSTNGYMQWLTADDDNGNLSDGTPHMTAIHAAYNRHGIACATPAPVNSGCGGQPNGGAGPTLSATAGNFSAALSWNAVAGASRYWVMRTEGHAGAEFGKTRIADITGTSFTDTQVANGRSYWYNVVAQGTSAACYSRVSNAVQVIPTAPTTPDFSVSCSPSSLTVSQGGTTTSTCTVSSTNGFASAVTLSCTGMPSGSSCGFSPNPVTPPANGSVASTLTVSATATAATGSFSFQVQGVGGSLTRTFGMSLSVNPVGGGGDEIAVFDAALQAPKCAAVGRSCDTGPNLVKGRDNMAGGGAETNQPNTINDSCADGTSGTYLTDESSERLKVVSVDGTNFAPGKQVRIEATVHVWPGGPTSDHLDLYRAANANSPSWTAVATNITPTSGQTGIQTFTATYTLPSGGLQAVRAQFRYQGTASSCTSGSFNDRDDLVFAVGGAPPVTTVFEDNFTGNLGWTTNPNGTDTATTGAWQRGDPQPTTSSGAKQLDAFSAVNDLATGLSAGTGAGAFDIDGGTTSIQSPAITLPASGTLTLSFQYYLAHGSNSSSADFFRAFVVVGTTPTQVFQSLGAASNRNGVWTAVNDVSLNAFAGQTIRIRFDAADASTASLVEAGVDDVKVTQQ